MLVPHRLALFTLLSSPFVHSIPSNAPSKRPNVPPAGYFDPSNNNGSMLTFGFTTFPADEGEPINVIISGNSHPDVLVDQQNNGGLKNFWLSFQFAVECLGQHQGSSQMADLGDGNGGRNETAVMRYDYNDPALGTCKETVQGGDHFRYWVQNGPAATSGAVFMAVSYELPMNLSHDVIFDGYNLGRDWLVGNITGFPIPTAELTNTTNYTGTTNFGGYTYQTAVNYTSGLLQNSSDGINHFRSVGGGPNNISAIDGLVAVLTVNITGRPTSDAAQSWTLAPWRISAPIWLAGLVSLFMCL